MNFEFLILPPEADSDFFFNLSNPANGISLRSTFKSRKRDFTSLNVPTRKRDFASLNFFIPGI
ncbi:MAG: hypothetical protein C4539_02995 [Ignavibacteriales bacterium]|nr:MAG: hypothetical protein C4539_02995 [Ignavibacteriales bacterium]